MRPNRIPIDGLWRCLCPSIDVIAISSSSRRISTLRPGPTRPQRGSKRLSCPRIRIQPLSAAPQAFETTPLTIRKSAVDMPHRIRKVQSEGLSEWDRLDEAPLSYLHERLVQLTSKEGTYHQITDLVEYLVTKRGEKPGIIHYEALIRANSDAENGSAAIAEGLLDEMQADGIAPTSSIYHGVLQVLAIHPDYLLRNQVMQDMKQRWFGLSPEGWHHLVTGLLRDQQYESAMDKLEQMQNDGLQVQPWLYDIFMYRLCEAGELEEVFKMMKYRFENMRADIEPMMWSYLLEVFSRGFFYEGVKYIWYHRVRTAYISPSDGMCLSILNLAARNSDPNLATSVVRILSQRRTSLGSYHYEALLEAYVGAKDLATSFRILIIMSKAGVEPDSKTTRPLFLYLSEHHQRPYEAWKLLVSMNKTGHVVPIGAVNVILEASVSQDNTRESIELYKQLHTFCVSGPNTETFNVLLRGLSRKSAKDTAMFLAAEMRALNIAPDRLTYDRLILICLREDDYEDAFKYLEELKVVGLSRGENWWMRTGTVYRFVKRCVTALDERAWALLEEMEKRGITDSPKLRIWAEENWEKPQDGNLESAEKLRRWSTSQ